MLIPILFSDGKTFPNDYSYNNDFNLGVFMVSQEKVLPQIKLKYWKHKKLKKYDNDLVCYFCNKTGIAYGGVRDAYSDFPKVICEECAIKQYRDDYGFKTLKAAEARRRRMFDVGYLFNEMIVDKYMQKNNINDVDDMTETELDRCLEIGGEYYNNSFSKKQKMLLEEMEDQREIEKKLIKVFQKIPDLAFIKERTDVEEYISSDDYIYKLAEIERNMQNRNYDDIFNS